MDSKDEFTWTNSLGEENKLKVTKDKLIYFITPTVSKSLIFKDFTRFKYREAFFNPEGILMFYGRGSNKPAIKASFHTCEVGLVARFYNENIKPKILACQPKISEDCFKNEKKFLKEYYYSLRYSD